MIALVLGHESIDLKRRFPNQNIRTILDYPENKTSSPDLRDRLTSLFWVVSGLIISNFLIEKLNGNIPPLFGEPLHIFPNLENTWLPLLSMLFLFVTTLMLKRKDDLREWEISGFIGLGYAAFIALLFPAFGAQYFPAKDSTLFAVPIFLILISLRGLYKQSRLAAVIFTIIAAIVIIIQLANSRSAVLHGIVSVLIFLLSAYYLSIWIFLKNTAEKIANSWVEWTFGKVRVLNRGFYTGPGVFFTILVAGILAGKDYGLAIMICAILLIICAGLWAQIIEGSEKLKRPFGYYGGLYGLLIASVFVWLMGLNMWVVLGTSSVVMTWGQAIGRLGCLVNGCCHGGRTDNSIIGIRYFHPRSRVSIISGLKGELVHPTQLYSIIWLFFVGIFLFALWMNHHSYSFIFGIYLILTSLGRFVEEAYRGEKQTLIIKGLRLYQWIAMITFIIGIVMTLIKINPVVISPGLYWETICYATIGGLFAFFAMGVDFPYSNARFSRLV